MDPVWWGHMNPVQWRRDYPQFADWFISRCFSEPHSTKGVEDGVGWALDTDPETLGATATGHIHRDRPTLRSLARNLDCRVLVVQGDRDKITPPRDVQDAMNRQLSAERTRRAVITESEGNRQAAINVAEGQKQSEILKAEGDRQAAILRAEGFSQALTRIFQAASGVDQKTMALQYLEALKALGASPATKFVIPTEFTRLVEPFAGFVQRGMGPSGGGAEGGSTRVARRGTTATPPSEG